MRVGYSYWGFLGDVKLDKDGNKLSTPDGNAFYSWSIIKGLLDRNIDVYQLMPDRDKPAYEHIGLENMFSKFCKADRITAYANMNKTLYDGFDFKTCTRQDLMQLWYDKGIDKLDVILHEWRMLIPGRNDQDSRLSNEQWQPDYFIQDCLIEFCIRNNISLIIFDLDYKITEEQFKTLFNQSPLIHLFELGNKWNNYSNCHHVEIPFDFEELKNGWKSLRESAFQTDLIYIGNRYERDDYIDKYVPSGLVTSFYGNWLQPGYDDCKDRWPHIHFGHRVQASEIGSLYDTSVCTILLAKDEYYKYGFMTARVLEALYYGCMPLFPIDYGEDVIERYAGNRKKFLTVRDSNDVEQMVRFFAKNNSIRNDTIKYLRNRLGFMDKQYIVNDITNIGRGHLYEV